MLHPRPNSTRQRGVWKINTAQVLIFVIALGGGGVVYNAYRQSHEPLPPPIAQLTSPVRDPRRAHLEQQVAVWRGKLTGQEMTLTWPYLGQDNVARVDLPSKTPITLLDWDARAEAYAARDVYKGFVQARTKAHIATPDACIIHVFDVNGQEVAQASASGVVTTEDEPIGPG